MESNRILVGVLLFILLVIGSNVVIYGVARGWTRNGDSRWMTALRDSLSKPMQSPSSQSMTELRKQMQELEKKKNANK